MLKLAHMKKVTKQQWQRVGQLMKVAKNYDLVIIKKGSLQGTTDYTPKSKKINIKLCPNK